MQRIAVFLFVLFSGSVFAQNESDSLIATKKLILESFNNFDAMHIGFYGTTQNCKPYRIYAFKYKRTWMLVVNQRNNTTLLVVNPPVGGDKKINDGSQYLLLGLGKCTQAKYVKLKKRRRGILDMKIYGIYKFNRLGRKAIKGLLLVEYPRESKGFLFWGKPEAPATPEGITVEINKELVPEVKVPEVKVPEVKVPEITPVEVTAPEIKAPTIKGPTVK